MARTKVEIKLDRAGVRDLLRSPEVQADLTARAQRIAAAAGEGFQTDSGMSGSRARASVRTDSIQARIAEAKHRRLTTAIGAGR